MRVLLALLVLVPCALAVPAAAQQVRIDRVERMPALPPDYALRDWKRVARAFDSLAFDPARQGTYLPLVGLYAGGPNYPAYGGFGLATYVGGSAVPGEAITALPALVGATLVGADKRTQFGVDWVLRSQQFFNRRPEEDVYLNNPVVTSGQDWWYDTMPNVFFYQLRALYPGVGEADAQFVRIAERWAEAVRALGGRADADRADPWALPVINYRAFRLSTMSPRLDGVPEPEAAGAIAWLLYAAYRETGEGRFRIAAELALDALAAQTQNPAYELQLPYGVLAAARMNAELGTDYDVERLLGWTFERGPLRGWGTLAGATRGGRTLDGLVGEVDGDGYAFALNGFQQAAALVPVARYDDRFARAIGRWAVNLASASRLFYRPSLPPEHQDGHAWSAAHDPHAVIPYEALRGVWQGRAPFATGDALRGGWAPTNLALYGGASAGYLAAIVDSTEVPGVLRLDLRRTDAYRPPSYPSFLVYNPHPTPATVTVPLPFGRYDVYDAAADAWLDRGVTGRAAVTVPPDEARVLVFPTAGGAETLDGGVLRVNGVAVDYRVGPPGPPPVRVRALVARDATLGRGQETALFCTASRGATATWAASGGRLAPDGPRARWAADEAGAYTVTCTATAPDGRAASATLPLAVVANRAPTGVRVRATPDVVDAGREAELACQAEDPDGDALAFAWAVSAGRVEGEGPRVRFVAPEVPGPVTATCTARDPAGLAASAAAPVTVGRLVLHLALAGDARDQSGFGHDGELQGAVPAPGRTGTPGTALGFDGQGAHVAVAATPALTPAAEVSFAVWARPEGALGREAFLASHGSWQMRWKLSLTPEGRPRWTVRTAAGVADLDGPAALPPGRFSHLAATFDGARMRLYVDGALAAERAHAGALPPTALPLLLGQMLPGQPAFNFAGALDEARLYNRALSADEARALFTGAVSAEAGGAGEGPLLGAPFPNPARARVTVPLVLARAGRVRVTVADALGRTVAVLHDGPLPPGTHVLTWDAARVAAGVYALRVGGAVGPTRHVVIAR